MEKTQLKNILTKIGQINPKYDLEKWVYNNAGLIQFMDNPSEEVQLAAVKDDPWAIKHIQNPSERVGLVAVEKIPYSIKYIQNPSQEVQLAAVKKNPYTFYHIKHPTEAVKQFLRSKRINI
jgi:hypothetical protein